MLMNYLKKFKTIIAWIEINKCTQIVDSEAICLPIPFQSAPLFR